MEITLDRLPVGRQAVLSSLRLQGSIRRRLLELGFTEGTTICCLRRAALDSPILYQLRGTQIALRKQDAQQIVMVIPCG